MNECECCRLLNVASKSPGLGYYCERCFTHLTEWELVGRPEGRFRSTVDFHLWQDAEHLAMLGPVLGEKS